MARTRAADDFAVIHARVEELAKEKQIIRQTPLQDSQDIEFDLRYYIDRHQFLAHALSDDAKKYFQNHPKRFRDTNYIKVFGLVTRGTLDKWLVEHNWKAQQVDEASLV